MDQYRPIQDYLDLCIMSIVQYLEIIEVILPVYPSSLTKTTAGR
jgi:hypothetical protein